MRRYLLLLHLLSTLAAAETIQVAYELELAPHYVSNLAQYFDLDNVPGIRGWTHALDDKVVEGNAPELNAETFRDIPEHFRKKLAQGLDVTNLNAPLPGTQKTSLVALDGSPLQRTVIDEIKNRWVKEWQTLTPAERKSVIPIRLLHRTVQAGFLIKALNDRHASSRAYPPLRPSSREFAEVVKGLEWHRDAGVLEFTHATPSTDPEATLAQMKKLAAFANASNVFSTPNGDNLSSYHLNISVNSPMRDVTSFFRLYQIRSLLHQVRRGEADKALSTTGLSSYTTDLDSRGMVRRKNVNYFEIRHHMKDADSELAELVSLLEMPAGEGEKELVAEVKARLRDEDIETIGKKSPRVLYDVISGLQLDWNSPVIKRALTPGENADIRILRQHFALMNMRMPESTRARLAGELLPFVSEHNVQRFLDLIDDSDSFRHLSLFENIHTVGELTGEMDRVQTAKYLIADTVLDDFVRTPNHRTRDRFFSLAEFAEGAKQAIDLFATLKGRRLLSNGPLMQDAVHIVNLASKQMVKTHPKRVMFFSNLSAASGSTPSATVRILDGVVRVIPQTEAATFLMHVVARAKQDPQLAESLARALAAGNLSALLSKAIAEDKDLAPLVEAVHKSTFQLLRELLRLQSKLDPEARNQSLQILLKRIGRDSEEFDRALVALVNNEAEFSQLFPSPEERGHVKSTILLRLERTDRQIDLSECPFDVLVQRRMTPVRLNLDPGSN